AFSFTGRTLSGGDGDRVRRPKSHLPRVAPTKQPVSSLLTEAGSRSGNDRWHLHGALPRNDYRGPGNPQGRRRIPAAGSLAPQTAPGLHVGYRSTVSAADPAASRRKASFK